MTAEKSWLSSVFLFYKFSDFSAHFRSSQRRAPARNYFLLSSSRIFPSKHPANHLQKSLFCRVLEQILGSQVWFGFRCVCGVCLAVWSSSRRVGPPLQHWTTLSSTTLPQYHSTMMDQYTNNHPASQHSDKASNSQSLAGGGQYTLHTKLSILILYN